MQEPIIFFRDRNEETMERPKDFDILYGITSGELE